MSKKKRTGYADIKERLLKEEILIGNENDRLPSRSELINKYGVTRTTIERAISELTWEGYLSSRVGSGTYIAPRRQSVEKLVDKNGMINWGIILA